MNLSPLEIKKEIANSLTHGLGVLFGLVSIPVLIAIATNAEDVPAIVGTSIFGFSFLMVFACSTIYHSISHPSVKLAMRTMDHISIYFMIAGSYTPFVLIFSYNQVGLVILSILWGLTLVGIIFKIFFVQKFKLVSTLVYVAMGALILVAPQEFRAAIPENTFLMLAVGGAFYIVGVVFYMWEKLTFNHAIWHLFVLAGSICHYVAVLLAITN